MVTDEAEGRAIAARRIAECRETRGRELDLGGLMLTALPDGLEQLDWLEFLYLGVDEDVRKAPDLPFHSIDNCNALRALPGALLEALSQLRHLDLSYNRLYDDLPAQISMLTGLNSLDLTGNRVGPSTVRVLANLTSLTSLNLGRHGIGDEGARMLSGLTGLTSLGLMHNAIGDDGARAVAGLTGLTSLDLAHNKIGADGAQALASLSSLTTLKLAGNVIGADGARAVAGLTGLTSLDLAYNKIGDDGAQALASLSSLNTLNLGHNVIGADGTRAVGSLTGLTSLDLSSNPIGGDGARALVALTGLTSLNLGNSGVTDLSPLINRSSRLKRLSLEGCHLEHETAAFWLMDSLETVTFGDGSLRGIPSELLSSNNYTNCLPALRAHILDLLASDRDGAGGHAIADVKMMILGNGNAGKTQLCRRLRGEPYDESVRSTHGIQVTSAQLTPDDEGNAITLRIWDFGGQDIYHGTHALFLKSRAVFPIVWSVDTNEQEEHERHGQRFRNYPLDYWLAYVKHLGGRQSPVLLVQSKVDAPADRSPLPLPADWAEGLDWHEAFNASAKTARGVEVLKHHLTNAVHWLRGTEGVMKIGGGRAAVKAQLDAMVAAGRRTLSQAEFAALCAADGRISSAEMLLDFLHLTGTVFYRKYLFGGQIILDQQWMLGAVYAVFDRERSYRQLLQNGGRFTPSLLGALVWDADGHSLDDQAQLLGFMRASGMCFVLRTAVAGFEAEYIAPDLLPGRDDAGVQAAIAGFDWERSDATGVLEYALLPQGLLRTVMAAIGENAGRAGTYWRDGFSFYDAGTKSRALVEQEIAKDWSGELRIQCHGGDAEVLLRTVLKLLHERTERFGARPAGEVTSLDHRPGRAGVEERDDPVEALKPAHPPAARPEHYVSYAWGDASPEGRAREQAVEALCASLEANGRTVVRDKTAMAMGEEIPKFMDRLIQAETVYVVLSDKYLRSKYCLYELFGIWRECREYGEEFARRIKLLVLDDAAIYSDDGIDGYTAHWAAEAAALERRIADKVGQTSVDRFARFKRFQRYETELETVLEFLRGTLHARTLDAYLAQVTVEL